MGTVETLHHLPRARMIVLHIIRKRNSDIVHRGVSPTFPAMSDAIALLSRNARQHAQQGKQPLTMAYHMATPQEKFCETHFVEEN